MTDELSAIRKRHSDIPQDALFEPLVATGGGTDADRAQAPKSVRWARCPDHVPGGKKQLTGLVLDGDRLVFRDHTKTIGRQTVPCPGSRRPWAGATNTAAE